MEVPFEERLNYLTAEYGKFEKEKLVSAVTRIQKRLGGLDTKLANNFLLEDNYTECFSILLKYYDKFYNKSLYNRENIDELLIRISFDKQNVNAVAELPGKRRQAETKQLLPILLRQKPQKLNDKVLFSNAIDNWLLFFNNIICTTTGYYRVMEWRTDI